MILSQKKSEVVIVGAGLSGLIMAAQLLRYDIRPMIIDQRSSIQKANDHIIIRPSSCEILRQIGLSLPLKGFEIEGITVQHQKKLLGSMRLEGIQIVPLRVLEQLLIAYLTRNACPIYWSVLLDDMQMETDYYKLSLTVNKRTQHTLQCQWLIGADGLNSSVRRGSQIGLDFEKNGLEYFTTDLPLNETQNHDAHLFLSKKGFVSITPVNGSGNYRMIGTLNGPQKNSTFYNNIAAKVQSMLGFKLPVDGNPTLQWEKGNERIATDFYKHRSLLISGAAHSQHPLLADSLDQAIQDTHNLAWKLAYTIQRKTPPALLRTYTQERKDTLHRLFKKSGYFLNVLKLSYGTWGFMPTFLIGSYFRNQSGDPYPRIHYKNSPLSVHLSMGKKIRAGEWLPALSLYHEKEKKQTDLQAWCQKPGFTLLILGNITQNHLFILAQWMQQKYASYMHLYYLPYSTRNEPIFRAFEVKEDKVKMILVRPDMFIAYMHDIVSANLIDTYMAEVMQWRL